MAKSTTSDIVKITISARGIPDVDPVTKQPTGTFRNILKNNITDLRSFERVIQSAVNKSLYFNEGLRSVDPNSGLPEQSIFIKKEDLKNTYGTLMSKAAELSSKRGGAYVIEVHSAEEIKATKTIYGKDAQKKAIEELYSKGGKAKVNASDPDKLDITLPYEKSALIGMSQKQKRALIEKVIPEAMKLSDDEKDKRKKEEEDKKIKEQEKRTANELKLIKEQNIAKAKARKEADKLIEDANKKAEADIKKKDKERKKKAEAEKKEAKKKEAKKKKKSEKKAVAVTKAILAVVTVIGDLVRRILTSTLKQASENNKMAVEAHSVGMTAMQRRGFDIFDVAHGMEKGTTFGAIQSVQGMFGDITSLDEKALGTLARVMGNEIGDLVRSGIGGQNPDKLLDKILDKYFKQFLSGRNSLGQSVGMEQARRELITSLQSVSPEIAKLFARMADDYTSGYYKPFGDTAGWRETTKVNMSGLTEADQKFSTEIGKKYNEIIAIVEDLKTSFFTRLATSMDGLLTQIKNLRIGQSEKNKIEEDEMNWKRNEERKDIMTNQLKLYKANSLKTIRQLSAVESTPVTEGVTKAQAERFKYDAELLAGIHSGIYDENYFKEENSRLSGTGMSSVKEVKAYIERGKAIADNALFNKEVQDEIARAVTSLWFFKQLSETNKNEIGSGKIIDMNITEAMQTQFAQNYVEDNNRRKADYYAHTQAIDTAGLAIKDTIVQGYIDFFNKNPEAYSESKNNMSNATKRRYNKIIENIARDKGISVKDLTDEDRKMAFAETISDLRFRSAVKVPDKITDTFIMNRAGIDARDNINIADSKVLTALALQGLSILPNTSYHITGKQGESGEYTVKIQIEGSDGKTEEKVLTLSDFRGQNRSMFFRTDSNGSVSRGTEQ